jgi:hypothetical protein
LLRSLLIFQGQRLSYRTLDVEQIGSVYEALMGYHVNVCKSPAVAIKIKNKKNAPKYWIESDTLQSVAAAQRLKWLQNDCGFDKAIATKIKKVVDTFEKSKPENRGTLIDGLLPLATVKKDRAIWKSAQTDQYVFQPGAERRRSGSHYTPRSLTSPIVQKTLQPLLRCLGDTPTAEQILDLKFCDPAMGSGAFLVECCRQLAEEVVAAWGREKQVEEIATLCPEGDVVAHARRLVAQRCLYGVDKNIMAVQLAKLSLWLFTLARELPFTFLDHSLRYGDSLVGLNVEQIKAFHWKPEQQMSFLEEEVNKAFDEVVSIRQEIHELAGDTTPEGQKLKSQRLFDANDATEKVRKIADVCVGAFFDKDKGKLRLEERQRREDIVRAWQSGNEAAELEVDRLVKDIRELHAPFHWWIEFPEVFYEERPDPLSHSVVNGAAYLDGVVGNPPFLGGKKISTMFGSAYGDWISQIPMSNKNSDLSVYFFRRSAELIGHHGAFGLISTNTISQGDTRKMGLQVLLKNNWSIYDSIRSLPWPGAAVVTVTIVHLAKGLVSKYTKNCLDGRKVQIINSHLRPKIERPDPKPLSINRKFSYQGVILRGKGFVLTPGEKNDLEKKNILNKQKIKEYIGGDEVNSSPTQSPNRFVIDMDCSSLDDLESWADLKDHLVSNVKPERDKAKDAAGYPWWLFWRPRGEMHEALNGLTRCIVTSRVSSNLQFSFQPIGRVFSEALYVFPMSTITSFSVLQSRIHDPWAWLWSSTMKNDIRYSADDCFSTFPFPNRDPMTIIEPLEKAGAALYQARARYMVDINEGLTVAYNALKAPERDDEEILDLRYRHEALDRAVLDAYGWTDIDVPPYCPATPEEEVALEAFNDEIIDRLYVLNADRAAEEEQQGLTMTATKKKSLKKSTPKKPQESNPTLDLF